MKNNYKKQFFSILDDLLKAYPTYTIGRHISTAMADYGDFWGITDKEFCFALEKYQSLLELDANEVVSEEYLKEIEDDANHLFDPEE